MLPETRFAVRPRGGEVDGPPLRRLLRPLAGPDRGSQSLPVDPLEHTPAEDTEAQRCSAVARVCSHERLDFFSNECSDLMLEPGELLGAAGLEGARSRQVHVHDRLDPTRPPGHYCHPVRQEHGLVY